MINEKKRWVESTNWKSDPNAVVVVASLFLIVPHYAPLLEY